MNDLLNISERDGAVIFDLFIQPRASRNEICGIQSGAFKIRLTSPPVDGAANKLCIEFLAKTLGIAKGRITIIAGEKSRHKKVRVEGIDKDLIIALTG